MRAAQSGKAMRSTQIGERFARARNRAAMASGLTESNFRIP
jgi:hypothetical protein